MSSDNTYDFFKEDPEENPKYFFISRGKKDIIKAVEFQLVEVAGEFGYPEFQDKAIYNLAFGDYDTINDKIIDDTNDNNGDVYKVFNTVLKLVPLFFDNYTNAVLMVRGSDGDSDFINNCRNNCKKSCVSECKNFKRRIAIYRHYLDKNYEELKVFYNFYGAAIDGDTLDLEQYVSNKSYDAVLWYKKNS